MAGHIALPSYQEHFNPLSGGKVIPATLSKELLGSLLREKMGFNGLIITDATPMVGFTSAMPRRKSIPYAIESGCDMILFNKDLAEDYHFMKKGLEEGLLSEKRLLEANRRILGMKAALRLHDKGHRLVPVPKELEVIKCRQHVAWARELADQSITLVKDTQKLLPINPQLHKRVLLEILGDFPSSPGIVERVKEALAGKGFEVTLYEPENFEMGVDNVTTFREKYDLVIYIGNVENVSNKTTSRLNWYTFWGQGNNVPWFVEEVPVLFISLANPYHLLDVPMIKTYINCYSNNEYVIEAVVEKITGGSEFKGKSPIDPFCGRRELGY
jgi:beta-N-acetylhexosaminidase